LRVYSEVNIGSPYEAWAKRSKASRIRPVDLRQALTPQERAYKIIKRAARLKVVDTPVKWCGQPYFRNVSYSRYRGAGFLPGTFTQTIVWDSNEYNRVVIKALLEARADVSRAIPNISKTLGVVLSMIRFVQAIKDCLRKRGSSCKLLTFRKNETVNQYLSRLMLYYNYSIKTSCGTLHDVMQELNDSETNTNKVRGHYKQQRSYMGAGNWQLEESLDSNITGYVELDAAYGPIDFGNPFEWIWEGIPFSFVLDWFIPVGFYISAFDAIRSIKRVDVTVTKRSKVTGYYVGPFSDYDIIDKGHYVYTSHTREIGGKPGLPDLFQFRRNSSTVSLINALNLLNSIRSF